MRRRPSVGPIVTRRAFDQSHIGSTRALREPRRKRSGQPPRCRPVTSLERRLRRPKHGVIGPGIVWKALRYFEEPRFGFLETIQLPQRLGQAKLERDGIRTLRVALECTLQSNCGFLKLPARELDCRELKRRARAKRFRPVRRQRPQQLAGFPCAAQPRQGHRAVKPGLRNERALGRRPLERAQRLDRFGPTPR